MARVGILGGSFNPVHDGHLRLAEVALARLGLDRVELVPANQPPHKPGQGLLPFADRAELCRVAADNAPGLTVNPLEGDRPGPSYTIDTLRLLVRSRPDDAFTFILGLGQFLQLPQWREGPSLADHADLAVAARPGDLEAAHVRSGHDRSDGLDAVVRRYWPSAGVLGHRAGMAWQVGGHVVRYLEGDFLVLSASQVRERWLAREPVSDLVPSAVAAWLDNHAEAVRAAWTA